VIVVMGRGHVLGADGKSWYNFWSGVGADLGGFAVVGAAIGLFRKHNCHVRGCWRIAKQQVVGTSWVVCHHHHPEGHPTAEQIAQVHSKILKAEHAALERATRLAERDRPPDQSPGTPT
jgi:hypothetical protein